MHKSEVSVLELKMDEINTMSIVTLSLFIWPDYVYHPNIVGVSVTAFLFYTQAEMFGNLWSKRLIVSKLYTLTH